MEEHYVPPTLYKYIENPELITRADFNKNGLYVDPYVAVTRNTGNWVEIGEELQDKYFNLIM
ncbi:hypothetical protein BUZ08_13730 [Staphylococcus gallinarum]|uniref:hypothetical protein n=1 Tax=Staphylococcus gallinarum TaxID=1293 RepID=UPI000D1E27B6|nr:hypothetical protein [Staphylococcus gallinarum]MCD8858267.1 hypothetical protein [Staphylococcus gallinarum]PTL13595.1 hypothetical protein BUZ08_13730 [Staphylococcus gallinarum]RIO77459.1 hypothetical protein BUZ07_11835 [Staphylococcus gallinarum]